MVSAVKLYKPKPVKTAVTVLAFALALALVMLGLDYASVHSGMHEKFTPLHQGIAYALLAILILLVSNGQGWARFLLGAWLLAGLALGGPLIVKLLSKYPAIGGLGAAQLVLVMIALLILFSGRANAWYRG